MKYDEKINKIYELFNEGKELTNKELNNNGISNVDLSRLTRDNILERIERGLYTLNGDNILNKAINLIANNEKDKAIMYLEEYYKLNKTNHEVLLYLLNNAVLNKEYDKVFEIIKDMEDNDVKTLNRDVMIYIYLLNMITEIPLEYQYFVKFMKFDYIKIEDKTIPNYEILNQIRRDIISNKFNLAKEEINTLINESNNIEYELLKTLIEEASYSKRTDYNTIVLYIKGKEYENLISYIHNLENKNLLNKNTEYVLKVAEMIVNINNTKKLPKPDIRIVNNVFEAIDNNNFRHALTISTEYNKSKNIDNETNVIYLILRDINNTIDMILNKNNKTEEDNKEKTTQANMASEIKNEETKKETATPKVSKSIGNNIESTIISKDTFKVEETTKEEIKEEKNVVSSIIDIITYLLKEDLDNAFKNLKSYLKLVDKEKYEFLVVDLIKLSVIEKDKAYTKPMAALNYLSRENFTFEISEYIERFYRTLTENKFEETRIYLDILKHAYELGQNCFLLNELEKILENTEKIANSGVDSVLKLKA